MWKMAWKHTGKLLHTALNSGVLDPYSPIPLITGGGGDEGKLNLIST